ncbi:conserved hypothetical protein, partial [Streptomyces albidoflavus]
MTLRRVGSRGGKRSGCSPRGGISLLDAGTDTRDPWTPAAGVQAADRRPCDLVTVPARQGLEAVDILRRGAEPAVGPVLLVGRCDTLGFLVPPGTA